MTDSFWGTLPTGTSTTNSGPRTDGIQFTVSQGGQITAIGIYVPSGGQTDGTKYSAALHSTTNGTSGTLLAGWTSGSGTFTTNAWNWISITPVTLVTGTTYVASISNDDSSCGLLFVHGYWSGGNPGASGVTSGALFAPGTGTALNGVQQPFVSSGQTFPINISSLGTFYGVDVQYSPGTAATVTGVGASVTAAGGVGAPDAGSIVTGVGASVTAAGGIGAPSIGTAATVTGVGASVSAAGGVGTPSTGVIVAGVGAQAAFAGGIGAPDAGATVTIAGVGAQITAAGGIGTPVAGASVSIIGVGAQVTVTGGIGTQEHEWHPIQTVSWILSRRLSVLTPRIRLLIST